MRALVAALCLCALAGCGQEAVVRVMDGDQVVGRFIDERAYDAYLRGALLEREGQLERAQQAYEQAHDADPGGVAPLVRLGAVRCARGPEHLKAAEQAFEAAARIEPAFAALYAERSRCQLDRGLLVEAERDARRALQLDPRDAETTVAYARVLDRTGRTRDAVHVLAGFVIWRPQAPEVWTEIEAIARKSPDAVEPWVMQLRPRRAEPRSESRAAPRLELVDRAIGAGDLASARALTTGRMPASAIAVRAAALGRWQIALDEAAMIASADPHDPDARAVLLAAPDVEQARRRIGADAWSRMIGSAADPSRPSPLAALVLADAIDRRIGAEARRAFLGGYGEIASEPMDRLREVLRARLTDGPPAPQQLRQVQ